MMVEVDLAFIKTYVHLQGRQEKLTEKLKFKFQHDHHIYQQILADNYDGEGA